MTKLTFETREGTYSIETKQDTVVFDQILEELIVPVFLAAGFAEKTVKEGLGYEY